MAQPKTSAAGSNAAARIATVPAQFNPNGLILLGTFGTETRPAALLRLANGNTHRIEPGDSLGRASVIAIRGNRVILETAGKTTTLAPPGEGPQATLSLAEQGQSAR